MQQCTIYIAFLATTRKCCPVHFFGSIALLQVTTSDSWFSSRFLVAAIYVLHSLVPHQCNKELQKLFAKKLNWRGVLTYSWTIYIYHWAVGRYSWCKVEAVSISIGD